MSVCFRGGWWLVHGASPTSVPAFPTLNAARDYIARNQ